MGRFPVMRSLPLLAVLLVGCDASRPVPADLRSTDARGADATAVSLDGKPPMICAAPVQLWDFPCFQACSEDSDCVRAKANCCPCASGGSQVPIHKGWTATFASRFANCSGPVGCPAVYLCESCADGNTTAPLACQAGRCAIVCP